MTVQVRASTVLVRTALRFRLRRGEPVIAAPFSRRGEGAAPSADSPSAGDRAPSSAGAASRRAAFGGDRLRRRAGLAILMDRRIESADLPEDIARAAEAQVAAGRFANVEDVVEQGYRRSPPSSRSVSPYALLSQKVSSAAYSMATRSRVSAWSSG